MRQIGLAGFMVLLCAALPGCDEQPELVEEVRSFDAGFDGLGTTFNPVSTSMRASSRLVYVPVYSRLFLSGLHYWELAASLSIRNTDPDQPITVYTIDYYDTAGGLIEEYLETPHELNPLSTVTLTLPQRDRRGGAGANFLVRWSGDDDVNTPMIEAVMAAVRGTQSFSFVRAGQEIAE